MAVENGRSHTQSDVLPPPEASVDAGAEFVLQSKGTWWHAGFHLTTAIVGPTILTLPYAFRGMGWALGLFSLSTAAAVTFYSYFLMSKVLDNCEKQGRRHIRFRELARDVLGSGWIFYVVVSIQTTINMGVGVGCILLSADCMEIIYSNVNPQGHLKLNHFITIAAAIVIIFSQLPSFHSLRYINLGSLVLSLGYTLCVVIACINAGYSHHPPHPQRDYSLKGSKMGRVFKAFNAMSILGSVFGNGILPEIQATVAPPATGKMFKGLCMCYAVMLVACYSVAVSGYWAFGNTAQSNILQSLLPDKGPAFAPTWLLGLSVVFVLLQLFAIALVYSQVAYEIMEKKSADVKKGIFAARNLIPRLFLRTVYIVICSVIAAMLPFFGDINALVGAIGFIPLDFILPMLLYYKSFKPAPTSSTYWINNAIMVIFTGVGIMGAFSSVRQIAIDANRFRLFSNNVLD
ncbi:probable GABA transporter 2 isoform X1 [Cryptomeria japonica]|uniref:probable GABA transporter 2 isoform X1 n=2 Tax=Cryptomeria japonica TaxID=3369 RepID=UPI0027DA2023|nr:probable GABA transporter 2 isoform X1 [Cryptomeria japonica]